MTGVLIKEEERIQRHREEGHVKTEEDIGVILPKIKEQ